MTMQGLLADLRKKNNLTQDELAEKLFVTRQAVSRWETGETTPNIETLKLISREFNLSIDELLGDSHFCQSCAMPIKEFDELGTESDGGVSSEYCSHCYQEGGFTHERTLDEMVDSNLRFLDEFNKSNGTHYTEEEAYTILKAHLADLKRWREQK